MRLKLMFPAHVMVWGCISGGGVGRLQFIDDIVSVNKYENILSKSYFAINCNTLSTFLTQSESAIYDNNRKSNIVCKCNMGT